MLHDVGGDAELLGVELNGAGLTAHLAVTHIRNAGVGIVELLLLPEVRLHLLDGVLSLDDILPILGKIHGVGEHTPHADDRNFFSHIYIFSLALK